MAPERNQARRPWVPARAMAMTARTSRRCSSRFCSGRTSWTFAGPMASRSPPSTRIARSRSPADGSHTRSWIYCSASSVKRAIAVRMSMRLTVVPVSSTPGCGGFGRRGAGRSSPVASPARALSGTGPGTVVPTARREDPPRTAGRCCGPDRHPHLESPPRPGRTGPCFQGRALCAGVAGTASCVRPPRDAATRPVIRCTGGPGTSGRPGW